MKPKTEELLYFLLWACDRLARPTFRNLTDSYESWAYRNGFMRQLDTLERARLLEKDPGEPDARIYRLTTQGRLCALGGRDPVAEWARPWDGLWRLVLFDVPLGQDARRKELRRYLQGRAFGCLQRSVWITPWPVDPESALLQGQKVDAASLLLLEGSPCASESNADLVRAAWDFDAINSRYRRYLEVLDQHPAGPLENPAAAKALYRWSNMERVAWFDAVAHDPLLPERLLPAGYQGSVAWQRRVATLAKAGSQAQEFTP